MRDRARRCLPAEGSVMLALTLFVLTALAWPPLWEFLVRRVLRWADLGFGSSWVLAAFWTGFSDVSGDQWIAAAIAGANLVIGVWLWWHNRRRRDRAPRAYGAKARVRIAALVAKVREAAKPRPVLRPAPGGAR